MQKNKLWIWQHTNYPHFSYDSKAIETYLLETTKIQGQLEGSIKHLSLDTQHTLQTDTILDEILFTSYMEGEVLQRDSVRSSLRKLFEDVDDHKGSKHTDNIASVQYDVNNNLKPLSLERLHRWHYELIVHGEYDVTQVIPGGFRNYDEMYVTSGTGAKTRVHYVAPPSDRLNAQIESFLVYCNSSTDNPLIQSAIAHIWFVQIHPYGDGNGRIARNITNYILSKGMGLDSRYFSLSHAINNDLKSYGALLEQSNRLAKNPNLDLTSWIVWHTQIIHGAIEMSIDAIDKTIAKTKFYDKMREIKISDNQSKAINFLLSGKEERINNSMYRVITDTSQVTASRQLNDLVKKGVLQKVANQKARSSAYELCL